MKTIITFITVALLATSGFSQSFFAMNYTMSLPVGETTDFISEFSFRGVSLDGRAFLNDNITIGGYTNLTVFNESVPDGSYTKETLTVSGDEFRYINSIPILFTGHYYLGDPEKGARFYGGAGVGTYMIKQKIDMGIWTSETTSWHFGFAPEIGVLIPAGFGSSVNLSVKWNYALKTEETVNNSWIGFNIGYAWNSL